jgi:hypothetical protein
MILPHLGETVVVTPLRQFVPVSPNAGQQWMTGPVTVEFSEWWCSRVVHGCVAWSYPPAKPAASEAK